ncbi:MAG: type IIL restriction-modification enzyme MmeI, partial [Planctomycetota bacterium]
DRAKLIYDYDGRGNPIGQATVENVSPYLTDGGDHTVKNRSKPLSDVPQIGIGNKPIDGGHYLFTPQEKADFLAIEPDAEPYFRRWFGAQEFLNGIERWCLWLGDVPPAKLRQMPHALARVEAVRKLRQDSKSPPTRKLASTPTRFHVENMPTSSFLVLPGVSSERRNYMPVAYLPPTAMASNLVLIVPNATRYHFGILHSAMHMAWVRQVCGRLKSDYRYSAKLVYNNFPWPTGVDSTQRAKVETAAGTVLAARENHPDATLADLYDPLAMPADLAKAHGELDRAVDRCYRRQPFPDERRRFEHLFALHERLVNPLTAPKKK